MTTIRGSWSRSTSLHAARVICRRAERSIVSVSETFPVSTSVVQFMNRLSDFLFVASRYAAFRFPPRFHQSVANASRTNHKETTFKSSNDRKPPPNTPGLSKQCILSADSIPLLCACAAVSIACTALTGMVLKRS